MGFVLRDARVGDLGTINTIYNHYIRSSTCTYHAEPLTDEERRTWFEEHQAAGGRYPAIVASDSTAADRVIGWGSLSPFHARSGYRFTVENSVYVHPDFHRQGIGRTLLAELIARSDTLGYRVIIAVISADQAPSVALHRQMGFVEAGLLRGVGFKFDRWLDVLYMQRFRPEHPGATAHPSGR